ncbi:MAG: D-cysteine desulfhydrase family protein [Planctomycetota bacterium]|nr:D-cysteine desulfhydrase family protein [Planctomycetota bacterium]
MTNSATTYSIPALHESIDQLPRFQLAHLPTPLEHASRFSQALHGPRIWIKRDDCTGLAFGGNKTRHNEFLIGDALDKHADIVVWGAGLQSNNCRQTAAACAKAGLDCHLVLGRGKPADGPDPIQGNLLLDHLVGASIEIVDDEVGPAVDAKIANAAARFAKQGRTVFEWNRKTVKPLAAVSYMLCMTEIIEQAAAAGFVPDAVYVCSAGSTGAGLALAHAALAQTFPVRHITPIVWPWDTQADMARIANDAAELLGIETRLETADIDVTEEYVGPSYGVPTPGCLEALTLLARTEGILLDPSYSGKAMAGLIDHVRKAQFDQRQNIVFVHTGGTPALFAHADELAAAIAPRVL